MPFVTDKFSPKTELQNHKNSLYLTEVQWGISDLPFVQNCTLHRVYPVKYAITHNEEHAKIKWLICYFFLYHICCK